jgi:hypothetical protein
MELAIRSWQRLSFRYTGRDWRDQREKELRGSPIVERFDRRGFRSAGASTAVARGNLPGVEEAVADCRKFVAQRCRVDGYKVLSGKKGSLPGSDVGLKSFGRPGVFHILLGISPPPVIRHSKRNHVCPVDRWQGDDQLRGAADRAVRCGTGIYRSHPTVEFTAKVHGDRGGNQRKNDSYHLQIVYR